jgi:sugar lactone lactonase YvrE
MDKKRIFFIILFIVATIGFGVALYLVFFAPDKPIDAGEIGSGTNTGTGQGFPQAPAAGDRTPVATDRPTTPTAGDRGTGTTGSTPGSTTDTAITRAPVLGISVGSGGDLRFYNKQDGKFYERKSDGTLTVMSDNTFYNAESVTWAKTADKAVVEYPDGSNIVYDFATKKQTSLPKHWEEFSFSPLEDKIVAKSITVAPENRYLVTADTSGKNINYIAAMGENAHKVTVDWSPNKQVVAFSKTGAALGADRQEILLVGTNNENLPSLTVEGRGFTSQWSPTGEKILYSVYNKQNEYKPELWIVNGDGDSIGTERQALRVNTWPNKCVFEDDRFVYCGVPTSLPTGAGYAPQIADSIDDTIYRIDTLTGTRTEIDTPETYTVESMTLSEDGETLYITDTQTSGLFSIPL